jgi:hypothetical protein
MTLKDCARACALLAALALGGCATTNAKMAQGATSQINWSSNAKRVVLMDPNVRLSELEAGGSLTPRADWTATAKGFIASDIRRALASDNIELVESGPLSDVHLAQLAKLHDAVGKAILLHLYLGAKLPTKGSALDYTLGPGVTDLRSKFGADYALFTYVEDSYTTAGRAFLMILGAAAGIGISGGQQVGFCSLVDLRTGNVVWFNLLSSMSGDLRTEKPAQDTVNNLLKGLPL